jgi:signal transduction histidine kinase
LEAWQRAYHTGEIYQIEHRVQLMDGSYRWHLSRGVPVRDDTGRIVKWFGTATDIENVKQAEAQLRQLNETLEQKVADRTRVAEERTRELQKLAVELIEAEERERQRVSRLLHDDLQQMLAAAKMQVQAVAEAMPSEPLLAGATQLLEDSIAKSRQLSHELSPAILHQSGFTAALNWLAGQMKTQFGLTIEVIANVPEQLAIKPVTVFLFQAARELLFNIVKHAGVQKAHISVSTSNGSILLTVSDQGQGFDPQLLGNNTSGFGLMSIKERASYIGGNLVIESEPGQGSRLTLFVPYKAPAVGVENDFIERPAGQKLVTTRLAGVTRTAGETQVMFVDDHKVIRQGLIRLTAGQPNIKVIGEASNGLEALELARRHRPDVIVMDVSMPVMDGIEATRRIKTEMPEIRVIGLSMHDDEQVLSRLRPGELSCKGYAEK